MPRFYVDVDDGKNVSFDLDGLDHPNKEAAWGAAVDALANRVKATNPEDGPKQIRADLRDECRKVIMRATVRLSSIWV